MSAQDDLTRKNVRTGLTVLAVIVGMVVLAFASVPLYRLFCQVTGFGGTPSIDPDAVASRVLEQEMTVRFNTDVAAGMPWSFTPETPSMTLKIGQKGLISFVARNNSREALEGTAIYNVLPEAAAKYFKKTQCFCFGRQSLQPGEEAHMPVAFFVDPAITEDPETADIRTITLSYSFFRADSAELEKAMDAYYQR